jgi:hypothetical protein
MAKDSADIDMEKLDVAAARDLAALGGSGAFDFLLEPGAEEQMWGNPLPG